MSSEQIAISVGTNASYIRKITAMLKKAEIIESHRGISGFALTRRPEDISLLDIYRAVTGENEVHLFDIHQNPSDSCIVGRNIKPVLRDMFSNIESEFAESLTKESLFDCIRRMEQRIKRNNL